MSVVWSWRIWCFGPNYNKTQHIDGLVQERRNSSALAMKLRLSCTNPSISSHNTHFRTEISVLNGALWGMRQVHHRCPFAPLVWLFAVVSWVQFQLPREPLAGSAMLDPWDPWLLLGRGRGRGQLPADAMLHRRYNKSNQNGWCHGGSCLVTWFCYQLITYPGNKTVECQSTIHALSMSLPYFNTLRPRQHYHHFANDICKLIFLNATCCILIEISLKLVSKGLIMMLHWFRSWLGAEQKTIFSF